MSGQSPDFPDDKAAPQRRKNLSKEEIEDLKLAGGVEGGMQAGSGSPEPSEKDGKRPSKDARSDQD